MGVCKWHLLHIMMTNNSTFLNGTFISHIPSFAYSYLEGMWVGFTLHDLKFITLDHACLYLFIYIYVDMCAYIHIQTS